MIRSWSARLTDPWVGRAAGDRHAGAHREHGERCRCADDGRAHAPPVGKRREPAPGFDLAAIAVDKQCEQDHLHRPSLETERVARLFLPLYRALGKADALLELLEDQPLAVARVPARLVQGLALGATELGDPAWSALSGATRRDLVHEIDRAFAGGGSTLAEALGADLAELGADRLRQLLALPVDTLAFEAGRMLGPAFARTATALIAPAKHARPIDRLPRVGKLVARLPAFVAARAAAARPVLEVRWTPAQLAAIPSIAPPPAVADVVVAPMPASAIADWNAIAHRAAELLDRERKLTLVLTGTPREIDLVIDALRRAAFVLEVQRDDRGAKLRATR